MASTRARATAFFLEIPRGARGVTAIPIAPAWEEPGVHTRTLTEAVLICMLVKLDSNDNPNYICLVYDGGYIFDCCCWAGNVID